MTASAVFYSYLASPIGRLLLAGDGTALHLIGFPAGPQAAKPGRCWAHNDKPFAAAQAQLREYFAGSRRRFDLPLATGGTDFQQAVWRLLQTIPYGETRSYGWLARELGRPQAARAVGAANGANPVPIIVPCHRVIGSDGSLTGFGGGIGTKRFLLALERGEASGAARPSPRARRA